MAHVPWLTLMDVTTRFGLPDWHIWTDWAGSDSDLGQTHELWFGIGLDNESQTKSPSLILVAD